MKRPWALPLVPMYAAGVALRSGALMLGLEQVGRLDGKVISIGSLSAGGAGKTPFVIALAKLLKERDIPIDVLSRGYGRSHHGAALVKVDGDPLIYGDEPLLITREAGVMVYVAAQRLEAGQLSEKLGNRPVLHLLDDGFQHRQLARDIDIVLISSADLQDWLLPAGDRREPLSALRRATVLAVTDGDDAAVERLCRMGLAQPVWRYRRVMDMPPISGPVVAFCGIARPAQFFSGLEDTGVSLAAHHTFPDHHRYTPNDLVLLQRLITQTGAKACVTTAKDQVRLGTQAACLSVPVHIAGLHVAFSEPEVIMQLLESLLTLVRSGNPNAAL